MKDFELEKINFEGLLTLLEHNMWDIEKEKNEDKKKKLSKLECKIMNELQKFYNIDYIYITEDNNGVKHVCDDEIKEFYVWSRDLFTDEIVKLIDVSTDRKFCDYVLTKKTMKEFLEENNINLEIEHYRKEELKEIFDNLNNQIKLTK